MMFQLHDVENRLAVQNPHMDITTGGTKKNGGQGQANHKLDKVKGLTFTGRTKLYCMSIPFLSKILCTCCKSKAHVEQLKILSDHNKTLTQKLDLSRILRRQRRFKFFLNTILKRLDISVINKG